MATNQVFDMLTLDGMEGNIDGCETGDAQRTLDLYI